MSDNTQADSLIHILIDDSNAALARLKEMDSQRNRRDAVRTIFAAIEGAHNYAKGALLHLAEEANLFSVHEIACLKEETYIVADNGVVRPQPKYVSLPSSIRQVAVLIRRIDTAYELDLNHAGWQCLLSSVKVRNRITHPRKAVDLTISDDEMDHVARSLPWVLAFVIEAELTARDRLKAKVKAMVEGIAAALPKET